MLYFEKLINYNWVQTTSYAKVRLVYRVDKKRTSYEFITPVFDNTGGVQ